MNTRPHVDRYAQVSPDPYSSEYVDKSAKDTALSRWHDAHREKNSLLSAPSSPDIHNMLKTLEQRIDEQQLVLAPIRRLPNEILMDVVQLLYDEAQEAACLMELSFAKEGIDPGPRLRFKRDGPNLLPAMAQVHTISHVCRRWRTFVFNTPKWWTRLPQPIFWQDVESNVESWVERYEYHVRFSARRPIQFSFTNMLGDSWRYPSIFRVFDVLLPERHRWENTRLYLGLDRGYEVLDFPSFQNLKSLSLFFNNSTPPNLLPLSVTAPQLTNLVLAFDSASDCELDLPWKQLRIVALDVRCCPQENQLRIYQALVSVERLTVSGYAPGNSIITLPSVHTFEAYGDLMMPDHQPIGPGEGCFCFPNLKSLHGQFVEGTRDILWLRRIITTSAHSTRVYSGVTQLVLGDLDCFSPDSQREIISLLNDLRLLRKLHLHSTRNKEQMDAAYLLRPLTPLAGARALCPLLQDIQLTWFSLESRDLFDMLESRTSNNSHGLMLLSSARFHLCCLDPDEADEIELDVRAWNSWLLDLRERGVQAKITRFIIPNDVPDDVSAEWVELDLECLTIHTWSDSEEGSEENDEGEDGEGEGSS